MNTKFVRFNYEGKTPKSEVFEIPASTSQQIIEEKFIDWLLDTAEGDWEEVDEKDIEQPY